MDGWMDGQRDGQKLFFVFIRAAGIVSFCPITFSLNRYTNCSSLRQWYSTFFPPVPLETLFHSTLYSQSCWCIIQVIHNYI
jgi:hypothetical protein